MTISDGQQDQQKHAAELIKASHNVDSKESNMEGDLGDTEHVPTNIEPFIRDDKKASGLTREELLKYADDPFWVRLRWATFVLFWLVWLALLISAVSLIATAPRCSASWSAAKRLGPLVELGESTWEVATERLSLLSGGRVEAVFLPYSLTRDVDIANATQASWQSLVAAAKKVNISVYVELRVDSVSTLHDWFLRSERGEIPYAEYFVWSNDTNDGTPLLGKMGWSWTRSVSRQSNYLSDADGSAVLNLSNTVLQADVTQQLLQWVDAGAGGVRLLNMEKWFTYRNVKLMNNSTHNESECYAILLKGWREELHKRGAALTVAEDVLSKGLAGVVDLPPAPRLDLSTDLTNITQDMKLLYNFSENFPSVKVADGGTSGMMTDVEVMFGLMLPAVPIFTWSQMSFFFDTKVEQSAKRRQIYDSTMKIREEIQEAKYDFGVIAEEYIIAFSRWKDDHGFVMAASKVRESLHINLTALEPATLPPKLDALVFSLQYSDKFTNQSTNPIAMKDNLGITDMGGIILKF